MRELGEGIRRIFDLMKEQELAAPQISSGQGRFTIAMNHKSIYSERELIWLQLFKDYDLDSYQKRILIAGINGQKLSPSMISAALGSSDRNLYDRTVTTLRVSGILREINSKGNVQRIVRETGKPRQDVVRFQVVTPDKIKSLSTDISNKVYVYGLPLNIDKVTLKQEFAIFGEVRNIDLPQDIHTGELRGFAYVEFVEQESALKAVAIKNIKLKDSVAGILPYNPKKRNRKRR